MPMTRNTSKEAYLKIKEGGLLSDARFLVYEILFKHGPLTGGDVFEHMQSIRQGHTVVKGSVCARLTECRELGVACEVGVSTWGATGHRGILWDVTSELPNKYEKPPTKDKIIAELREKVRVLSIENEQLRQQTGMARR